MTMPETDGTAPVEQASSRRIVRALVCVTGALFLGGAAAGVFAASHDDPGDRMTMLAWLLFGAFLLAALVCLARAAVDVLALSRQLDTLPRAERASTKFMIIAIVASVIGGGVAGILSATTGALNPGGSGIPVWLAIIAAIAMVTVAPWTTLRWWRQIDEHERGAYVEGANIASHAVLCLGFAWYALHLGRLAPEPDAMILILGMCTIWSAVWLYRKYA